MQSASLARLPQGTDEQAHLYRSSSSVCLLWAYRVLVYLSEGSLGKESEAERFCLSESDEWVAAAGHSAASGKNSWVVLYPHAPERQNQSTRKWLPLLWRACWAASRINSAVRMPLRRPIIGTASCVFVRMGLALGFGLKRRGWEKEA